MGTVFPSVLTEMEMKVVFCCIREDIPSKLLTGNQNIEVFLVEINLCKKQDKMAAKLFI